ncbi:MAG: biosynthetic-type acetolactate synthase large subunit [Firmicutes bacterium]|nr:biosynthetic-type acetolactate synthase large subunit [Bacillota bacterium]
MMINGAKILIECLLEQGVDTVFGYPGASVINLYDELYKYSDRIRHILTTHEQGAAHAADGYARSTGRVGVCFATSGPGCTNLTTGIATAYMDSSPTVFITCNVRGNLIGSDAFQEVDITGIAMPITKNTYFVRDVDKLADVIREAFAIARAGRPGPVLIDIVKEVTEQSAEYTPLPKEQHALNGRLGQLIRRASLEFKPPEPDRQDLDKLVEMIAESRKPLLICGGGVVISRAHEEFKEFAERIDAPVAITVMGGGGFPSGHPLTTGMIGMHGSQASNMACDSCDLLIAVGCRFSDRIALHPASFAAQAKIVQIDIDRSEVDKNVKTDHHIIGDAKQVLTLLNQRVERYDHSEWKKDVFSHRTRTEYEDDFTRLTPKQIGEVVEQLSPRGAMIATDVGQHQKWAIQSILFNYPGQLITSGGFGSMGFGLGAAIGAQIGNPDKRVIHLTGDGSFRMNCNELATVEHYRLPIVTIIYNNSALGMVRQWQALVYGRRFSQTTLDRGPDFVKLAEAYGLRGRRVTDRAQLEEAFREALAGDCGFVIDCQIDPDEMVHPMVISGNRITNFLLD